MCRNNEQQTTTKGVRRYKFAFAVNVMLNLSIIGKRIPAQPHYPWIASKCFPEGDLVQPLIILSTFWKIHKWSKSVCRIVRTSKHFYITPVKIWKTPEKY